MPEIKNNFTRGIMNKDLDERLVPVGEYTDAMNIQVTTSDGSDVGALQNILGNQKLSNVFGELYNSTPTCVGTVADEKNDAIYWLVNSKIYQDPARALPVSPSVAKDLILEYKDNTLSPVVVDVNRVVLTLNDQAGGGSPQGGGPLSLNPVIFNMDHVDYLTQTVNSSTSLSGLPPTNDPDSKLVMSIYYGDTTPPTLTQPNLDYAAAIAHRQALYGIHAGMTVTITELNTPNVVSSDLEVTQVIFLTATNEVVIYFRTENSNSVFGGVPLGVGNMGDIQFDFIKPTPVLNFKVDENLGGIQLITGINILDDNLFFTDNKNEPKKINIPRFKEGTVDMHTHTSIVNEDRGFSSYNRNQKTPIEEYHATVIKKSPLSAPNLKMISTAGENISCFAMKTSGNSNSTNFEESSTNVVKARFTEHTLSVINDRNVPFNWLVGDVILLKSTSANINSTPNPNLLPITDDFEVRARIVSFDNTLGNVGGIGQEVKLVIEILSIDPETPQSEDVVFAVSKEDISEKLFENKFCRFGYRWKYIDGEYSCFSPFSEIAFVPGNFDHHPTKGYNLAMSNRIKELVIQDFVTPDMPEDVVELDILYKETTSPNVYVVETLRQNDPIEPTYVSSVTNLSENSWNDYGSAYDIGPNGTSLISQLDLDYCKTKGSYKVKSELIFKMLPSNQLLRAFDNVPKKALAQEIVGNRLLYGNYEQNFNLTNHKIKFGSFAAASYDPIGEQGTLGKKSIKSLREYQVGVVYTDDYGRETPVITDETGGYRAPKFIASDYNNLQVKINGLQPDFAKYYKFYIKETSNEYYNLPMDRMYDGLDGSVWISFPSADRNKVDEDTYLILKKGNGENNAVSQEAKYKILAIDNEPNYAIKETKKLLGKLSLTPNSASFPGGQSVTSPTASPAGTDSFVFTLLDANPPLYSDRTLKTIDENTNKLKFRFVGSEHNGTTKGNVSRMHDISSITKEPEDTTTPDITFNVKLKDLIDDDPGTTDFDDHFTFDSAQANWSGSGQNLTPPGTIVPNETYSYIEFYEFVEENKKEYEGRFFVKINADQVVIDNFTKPQNEDDYLTLTSMPLFFLDNTSGTQFVPVQNTNDELVTGVSNTDGVMDTYSEWSTFLSSIFPTVAAKNKKYRWFIDKTNYYAPAKKTGSKYVLDSSPSPDDLLAGSGNAGTAYGISNPGINTARNQGVDTVDKSIDISYFGIENEEYDLPAHAEALVDTLKEGNFIQLGTDTDYYKITKVRRQNFVNYNFNTVDHGYLSYSDFGAIRAASQRRATFRIFLEQAIGLGSNTTNYNPEAVADHNTPVSLRVYSTFNGFEEENLIDENPAIWETEPKEDVGLDIYYEASNKLPIKINKYVDQLFIPVGSEITTHSSVGTGAFDRSTLDQNGSEKMIVKRNNNGYLTVSEVNHTNNLLLVNNTLLKIKHPVTGKSMTVNVSKAPYQSSQTTGSAPTNNYYSNTTTFFVETNHNGTRELDFSNCFSFGNGVESDRIRDTFNLPTIDNGVKVSTVLDEPFEVERRSSGLIYSGIYNSNSGVNNTNQFLQAEKITKDINPTYGSIQKLHTRDDDVLVLCEDKVLRVMAEKDALFNADGSMNVTTSNKVLGHAEPFVGDYGISKNPESFCSEEFRSYFVDKTRRAVLRLSRDGITAISEYGMVDWFQDNLNDYDLIIGSYDDRKKQYNVTLRNYNNIYDTVTNTINQIPDISSLNTGVTISYSEKNRGWVSFKSFIPDIGLSCASKYYTFNSGELYEHHIEGSYNTFYGNPVESEVTFLMNESPSSVKSYKTLNYEGTQTRVIQNIDVKDRDYYNLNNVSGWYCDSIKTVVDDKEVSVGFVPEFIKKEGKWFNHIKGKQDNLNLSNFNLQGLGVAISTGPAPSFQLSIQDSNDDD